MTIRLSADECTATIPPVKAVLLRFVEVQTGGECCGRCHFGRAYCLGHDELPCMPLTRLDGRNGYWVAKKNGKRVGK